jgi:hypothetical protein
VPKDQASRFRTNHLPKGPSGSPIYNDDDVRSEASWRLAPDANHRVSAVWVDYCPCRLTDLLGETDTQYEVSPCSWLKGPHLRGHVSRKFGLTETEQCLDAANQLRSSIAGLNGTARLYTGAIRSLLLPSAENDVA